jgi:medium-chain acyl-[acyl-carrier-protein] hydrolase
MDKTRRWLKSLHPERPHTVELFAFPYAGGGIGAFHSWHKHLPAWIRIHLVQLPGRENRFAESPASQALEIIEPVAQAIAHAGRSPFVIFGHSMGAILAFEVARQLRRVSSLFPDALIVSGRCAPQLRSNVPRVSHLDGPRLVHRAAELFGGIPPEVLENQELIELMARVLKADMTIVEEYRYLPEPPLDCPIVAYGGDQDPWASESELEAWREQTRAGFIGEQFPGDHFYLREQKNELRLLQHIREICSRILAKREIFR